MSAPESALAEDKRAQLLPPPRGGAGDLTGRRFGMLTVEGDSGERRGRCILYRCRCDCGGEVLATRARLLAGSVISCGCVPPPAREDLTGQVFGRLTVLSKESGARYRCRCVCGKEITAAAADLRRGNTSSCGCGRHSPPTNRKDLTGRVFGRLTVLRPAPSAGERAMWRCRCSCGRELDVAASSLTRGLSTSCGCRNREVGEAMHDHLHYENDTCVERLREALRTEGKNKAGFRGLSLLPSGSYRAAITFRGVHYYLGVYRAFEDAVAARCSAEESLHRGYLSARDRYAARAAADPAWASAHPFRYDVICVSRGKFIVKETT